MYAVYYLREHEKMMNNYTRHELQLVTCSYKYIVRTNMRQMLCAMTYDIYFNLNYFILLLVLNVSFCAQNFMNVC